jgi:hypothetical protein
MGLALHGEGSDRSILATTTSHKRHLSKLEGPYYISSTHSRLEFKFAAESLIVCLYPTLNGRCCSLKSAYLDAEYYAENLALRPGSLSRTELGSLHHVAFESNKFSKAVNHYQSRKITPCSIDTNRISCY